jgi:hypothetical protein
VIHGHAEGIAVGNVERNAAGVSFAETWNGTTWALQAVRDPARLGVTTLSSVSCLAGGGCVSAGSTTSPGQGLKTLIEARG